MVNFGKFDISVIVVMSLAVIVMSFTFPALGLTGSNVADSDVPSFNASANTFDLTGDTPNQPRTSDSGQIRYEESGAGASVEGVSLLYIQRPKTDGYSMEVFNASTGPQLTLINFSGGAAADTYDTPINNDTSWTHLHQEDGWTIEFSIDTIEDYNGPDMRIVLDYEIQSAPDDSDGISGIPLIGDTADLVATVLSYGITMFAYISLVLVEIVINTIVVIANISVYFVSMGVFLASTYASIISGTSTGWAAAVLTVPSVLLTAMLAKLVYLIIKAFPTT